MLTLYSIVVCSPLRTDSNRVGLNNLLLSLKSYKNCLPRPPLICIPYVRPSPINPTQFLF